MDTQASRSHHIWILLAAGLAVRLAVMFSTASVFYEPFLGWITLLSDIGIGYILYDLGRKAMGREESPVPVSQPLILAALWVFNPAAIFASTVGGFYEPIIVVAMMLLLAQIRHKIYSASVILFLPAAMQIRFWLQVPTYASTSALNFFALAGGFRQPLDTLFWGFRYSTFGVLFVLAIVLGTATALYADQAKGGRNYYLIIGGYFALLFMFAPNMQVSSLFPVPVMLLLHFIDGRTASFENQGHADGFSAKSTSYALWLYLAFSTTFFVNMYMMDTRYYPPYHSFMSDGMLFASVANVLLALILVYIMVNAVWPKLKFFRPPDDTGERQGIPAKYYIWILLVGGFIVRVVAMVHVDYMFGFDVWVFKSWAVSLYEYGFSAFYGNPYLPMTDYPPVYLYVLYVIGALASWFDWEKFSTAFLFITFLPAILCDLGIGYVLHRRAEKTQRSYSRAKLPIILAAIWILNPAVILISSVWGQVESVFSMILLLSLLLLRDKKLLPAYLLYGIAILTKPQSLFLGPVYLYSAIEYLQDMKFTARGIWRLAVNIFVPVALMLLLFVPFNLRTGIRFFLEGLGGRPYGSVNAFNFFWLIGGNFQSLDARFMGLTYGFIGMAVVATIILGAIAALFADRKRGGRHYFLIVGAVFALVYVFAFRMLDRYFFPALPFLLLHAIERRDRRVMALYIGFSATFYFNCFEMLRWTRYNEVRAHVSRSVAVGAVILGCLLVYVFVQSIWQKNSTAIDSGGTADEDPGDAEIIQTVL